MIDSRFNCGFKWPENHPGAHDFWKVVSKMKPTDMSHSKWDTTGIFVFDISDSDRHHLEWLSDVLDVNTTTCERIA